MTRIKSPTRRQILENLRGCVYAVEDVTTGHIKIGQTTALRNRMLFMASKTKTPLRLVGYILTNDRARLESHAHRLYKSQRVKGEWFALAPEHLNELLSVSVVNYHKLPPVGPHPGDAPLVHRRENTGTMTQALRLRVGEVIPRKAGIR